MTVCAAEQKLVYGRDQVDIAIRRLRRRGRALGVRERLHAYSCPCCGGWHLGHGNRPRRGKR